MGTTKDFQSELLNLNSLLQASITELRYRCEVYRLSLNSIKRLLLKVKEENRLRFLTTGRRSFQAYLLVSQKNALIGIGNVVRKASTFINGYSLVDKRLFQPPPPKPKCKRKSTNCKKVEKEEKKEKTSHKKTTPPPVKALIDTSERLKTEEETPAPKDDTKVEIATSNETIEIAVPTLEDGECNSDSDAKSEKVEEKVQRKSKKSIKKRHGSSGKHDKRKDKSEKKNRHRSSKTSSSEKRQAKTRSKENEMGNQSLLQMNRSGDKSSKLDVREYRKSKADSFSRPMINRARSGVQRDSECYGKGNSGQNRRIPSLLIMNCRNEAQRHKTFSSTGNCIDRGKLRDNIGVGRGLKDRGREDRSSFGRGGSLCQTSSRYRVDIRERTQNQARQNKIRESLAFVRNRRNNNMNSSGNKINTNTRQHLHQNRSGRNYIHGHHGHSRQDLPIEKVKIVRLQRDQDSEEEQEHSTISGFEIRERR